MAAESELAEQCRGVVQQRGGRWRKCEWVARRGAPDNLVWVPGRRPFWVELKAPGERPESWQDREHRRMRQEGHEVHVIDNLSDFVLLLE